MFVLALISNLYFASNGTFHMDNVAIRPTPGYECIVKVKPHKRVEFRGCTLTKD